MSLSPLRFLASTTQERDHLTRLPNRLTRTEVTKSAFGKQHKMSKRKAANENIYI